MRSKQLLCDILKIQNPIIQAGMAGGPTTPALVSSVSNAGALGTLGAGYMKPSEMRSAIREIKQFTNRPFAVNLFAPQTFDASQETISDAMKKLSSIREKLNIPIPQVPELFATSFEEQIEVVLEENVPVFSFTFGIPSKDSLTRLTACGIRTIGTATTVHEARLLEEAEVDVIVAQGAEAGGHRGTFAHDMPDALIGTMALIPQVVDAVNCPVVASGGLMDGRGMLAAMALGATGVQLGTAFLTCRESGAHPVHQQQILQSSDTSTVITRAFSGRPARGIRNEFIDSFHESTDCIAPYPVQNTLTRDIRQAATRNQNPGFMSLWAGQASGLSRNETAAELIQRLDSEMRACLSLLYNRNQMM